MTYRETTPTRERDQNLNYLAHFIARLDDVRLEWLTDQAAGALLVQNLKPLGRRRARCFAPGVDLAALERQLGRAGGAI